MIFERYAQDPEVCRYLTWRPHRELAETRRFIEGCVAAWQGASRRPWVISLADDERPIGMLEARLEPPHASFGYVLARSAWGQGYMTEAVRAVVPQLLNLPGIYRVWAV